MYKILLDIDDTALISRDKGKTWREHPRLSNLISNHKVFLYSGNPNIADYAQRWKAAGYIPKGTPEIISADVLIDNDYELWKSTVDVKKCYSSIDSFFRFNKKS